MNIGLVFEVASSYAIAAGEFGDPRQIDSHQGYLGLSWVAVWVVLFTIVVPTAPRRALVAALASVSSVSVIIGLHIASGTTTLRIGPAQFFVGLVFPYLVVVCMAYFGLAWCTVSAAKSTARAELGSYHLEEKLGQGGMGEVWRARHRMLARPAAIKLIRRSVAGGVSDAALQRFEREAQVIARLRSPHTVNLFDFGVAMTARSITRWNCSRDSTRIHWSGASAPWLPIARSIWSARCATRCRKRSRAVSSIETSSPRTSLFASTAKSSISVKVLDFGIVRAVRDVADTGPVETQENVLHGTPAFMAPEQAMGTEVDGRADVYATGCVAYWLLTGELVFTAETPMGVLVQHAQSTPSPPSARTDQPIPRSLDQLVLACLAKDPAKRPQSAKELAQQLAAIEVAERVDIRPGARVVGSAPCNKLILFMKIHEYQAKAVLAKYGVPVPRGEVAFTPEEVHDNRQAAGRTHFGRQGADSCRRPRQGRRRQARQVRLGSRDDRPRAPRQGRWSHIRQARAARRSSGCSSRKGLAIDRELYLGLVLDRSSKRIV
jgi:serine/threonine-protein kinase